MGETVLVITPYQIGTEPERQYAHTAFIDSLERGEVPFCPVMHYTTAGPRGTKALLDTTEVAMAWIPKVDKVVFYMDMGIDQEMDKLRQAAIETGKNTQARYL